MMLSTINTIGNSYKASKTLAGNYVLMSMLRKYSDQGWLEADEGEGADRFFQQDSPQTSMVHNLAETGVS